QRPAVQGVPRLPRRPYPGERLMFAICKKFEFEAAHQLPFHDGKCKNLHGHTYKVEVEVVAELLQTDGAKTGMVMDFGDLSAAFKKEVFDKLDRTSLTAVLPFPATAENLAVWIWSTLRPHVENKPGNPRIKLVKVWETSNSWA